MIKLDIDSDEGMYETLKRVRFYNYLFNEGKPMVFGNIYPTVKGWHVYFETWKNAYIGSKELIFFQLMFGSDPYREMMNLRRITNKVRNWNIMFTSREDRTQNYAELFNLYLTMKVL